MTFSLDLHEALERYLLAKMATLCGNGSTREDVDPDASRHIEELDLFGVATPFERVVNALGRGTAARPRVIEDAPESLRVSVEHRYALSRWPSFEFAIFESRDGIAWGQTFVRKAGSPIPPVRGIDDLGRWSHVESEVVAALGAPESREDWSPWESAIHRVDGVAFELCYVYGLLQQVRSVTGP